MNIQNHEYLFLCIPLSTVEGFSLGYQLGLLSDLMSRFRVLLVLLGVKDGCVQSLCQQMFKSCENYIPKNPANNLLECLASSQLFKTC